MLIVRSKVSIKGGSKEILKSKSDQAALLSHCLGLTCGKNAARAMRRNERDVDHPVPGAVDYHSPKTLGCMKL